MKGRDSMANYILFVNTEDNFGIDAEVHIYNSVSKAKNSLNQKLVAALKENQDGMKDWTNDDFRYRIVKANGSVLSGFVNNITVADCMMVDPNVLVSAAGLMSKHNLANIYLNSIVASDKRKNQLEMIDRYRDELRKLETMAQDVEHAIENAYNTYYLYVDESDGELGNYVLFHSEENAKEYLDKRFADFTKDFTKSYTEKEMRERVEKTAGSFQFQGDYYNTYGKITKVVME